MDHILADEDTDTQDNIREQTLELMNLKTVVETTPSEPEKTPEGTTATDLRKRKRGGGGGTRRQKHSEPIN